jgi:phenylalanyl-tRNA synthetase alpha chain
MVRDFRMWELHPQLIKDCGKNENEWSGLALGIGLDRAVMVKKNISDIRVLL